MAVKKNRLVIITGAGFSAPANLPIQNKIIDKMIEEPLDFMAIKLPHESIRFLDAYINVGIFLLDNYGKGNYQKLSNEYYRLKSARYSIDVLLEHSAKITDIDVSVQKIESALHIDNENYLPLVYDIRSRIRHALQKENIHVNLEDIFTSFDKAVMAHEHVRKYSYAKMDEIRYSIMRLFIYYFSKCVIEHNPAQEDYLNFVNYVKSRNKETPVTIVTTNWDTLTESYFDRYGITYSYGFRSPYTSVDNQSMDNQYDVLLLKMHGSANWLKCFHCGSISVFNGNDAAESLFDDSKQEVCAFCSQKPLSNTNFLQPEIITPTMLKSLTSRIYSNIWGAAASEIRNATQIIFAGYSLPMADFDFRYLLQKNVSQRAKIDVVLWKDDDPTQTENDKLRFLLPEKRYSDSFSKNKIQFVYSGFKDFFAHST